MALGRAEMGSWAMGDTLRALGRAIRDYWCPQGPDKPFQQRVKVSGFSAMQQHSISTVEPSGFEKAAATKGEGGSGTLSDGLLGNDK